MTDADPHYLTLLRQAHANVPINHRDLSERANLSRSSLASILAGKMVGSTGTISRIAAALTGTGSDAHQAIVDAHERHRLIVNAPRSRWDKEGHPTLPGMSDAELAGALRDLTAAVQELTKIMRERP